MGESPTVIDWRMRWGTKGDTSGGCNCKHRTYVSALQCCALDVRRREKEGLSPSDRVPYPIFDTPKEKKSGGPRRVPQYMITVGKDAFLRIGRSQVGDQDIYFLAQMLANLCNAPATILGGSAAVEVNPCPKP